MVARVNISLSADTLDRLDQYALENHLTRSSAISRLVWDAKVKYSQVKGQISMDELAKDSTRKRASRT